MVQVFRILLGTSSKKEFFWGQRQQEQPKKEKEKERNEKETRNLEAKVSYFEAKQEAHARKFSTAELGNH